MTTLKGGSYSHERWPFFEDPRLQIIAEEAYLHLPRQFPNVSVDTGVVMADHVHLLLALNPPELSRPASAAPPDPLSRSHVSAQRRLPVRAQFNCALTPPPVSHEPSHIGSRFRVDPLRPTLGQVIRAYKARVTRQIHQFGEGGFQWRRNYYERVIRNVRELHAVRQYILLNPERGSLSDDSSASGTPL